MWILIAIVAVVVAALAFLVWRRPARVADDVRQWEHSLDALGRTAERAPVGGATPEPGGKDVGDSVRVLGSTGRDDDA